LNPDAADERGSRKEKSYEFTEIFDEKNNTKSVY